MVKRLKRPKFCKMIINDQRCNNQCENCYDSDAMGNVLIFVPDFCHSCIRTYTYGLSICSEDSQLGQLTLIGE